MKSRFIAVQRYYKGNVIDGYAIQDIVNGAIKEFKSDELKSLIASGRMNVANLSLTSDGKLRLITDDERINNALNIDGKADNDVKYTDRHTADMVVKAILKEASREYRIIQINNFNKDTNTFVIDFRTSKIMNKNAQILFKYSIKSGYKVYIKTVPVAIRFSGQIYPIKLTKDNREYVYEANSDDIISNGRLNIMCSVSVDFARMLYKLICETLRDIVISDEKAMRHLNNLTKLDSNETMLYHHEAITERNAAITSSAITYAAMFAIFVTSKDPAFSAILTATCGSLVNGVVQHIRMSVTDYQS